MNVHGRQHAFCCVAGSRAEQAATGRNAQEIFCGKQNVCRRAGFLVRAESLRSLVGPRNLGPLGQGHRYHGSAAWTVFESAVAKP